MSSFDLLPSKTSPVSGSRTSPLQGSTAAATLGSKPAPAVFQLGMRAWVIRNKWWLGLMGLYIVVGAVLVFGFGIIMTDAISRVANASYVMRGREPHLAAVGFVWTPLTSLLLLPILPFAKIFPFLLTHGFAANIASAGCMAAAAREMHRVLGRLGMTNRMAGVVCAAFALHPMIVFYGANGMSEALATFGLLLAIHALLVWIQDGITVHLVVCGIGIAIAYLARYEAGLAFFGAAAIVVVVSWRRASAGYIPPMSAMRLNRAGSTSAGGAKPGWIVLNELLLLSIPAALSFLGWATMSWVVTGHPFEQLSSEYGIREFVKTYNASEGTTGGSFVDIVRTFGLLQPMAILFLLAATIAAVLRRNIGFGVVAALSFPVLAFNIWTINTGQTLYLYRYLFQVIPLVVAGVGVIVAVVAERTGATDAALSSSVDSSHGSAMIRRFAFLMPVALLVLTTPVTLMNVIKEERNVRSFNGYQLDGEVATFVDSLNADRGSILTDSGTGFGVLLKTKHPDRFVITSDSDFRERVADLSTVSYVLVPENTGLLQLDALNKTWPTLFENGPSANSLVKEWKAVDGRPAWRLFKVEPAVAFQ